jgi:hypothetical protein
VPNIKTETETDNAGAATWHQDGQIVRKTVNTSGPSSPGQTPFQPTGSAHKREWGKIRVWGTDAESEYRFKSMIGLWYEDS